MSKNAKEIKKEISLENIMKFVEEAYTLESDALENDLPARWVTARRSDMLTDYFSAWFLTSVRFCMKLTKSWGTNLPLPHCKVW